MFGGTLQVCTGTQHQAWLPTLPMCVQGIIVDAFSEIRSDQAAQDDHANGFCLVCSMDNVTLDKIGLLRGEGGFTSHIENDHSPWSYLYYYVLLDELDYFRVTKPLAFHRIGIAQYVSDSVTANTVEHMPIKTCWANEKADQPEDLDSLAKSLQDVKAHMVQIEYKNQKFMASLEEQMKDLTKVVLGEMNSPRKA